jgi:hypothetical protein
VEEKKFKEQLSKIAKWYIPIVSDSRSGLRKPMPGSEPNEKMGPIIDHLLPRIDTCEWCGITGDVSAKNHILRFTSLDGRRPARRWEHNCQTCKRQLDPATGKLKEKPKSRYQEAKELYEKTKKPPATRWWNDPAVYSDSDKNKPGKKEA